jgi:hypothetical protein
MTDFTRRVSLALLLFLLIFGVVGHLFSFTNNISHITQEANCPIHCGIAQPERAQTFTLKPAISIGETQDGTHALNLGVKISHPPTF